MDKFMEKIKGTKILGIIGNLILAVAVFLPVLTVSVSLFGISQSQSISYIQGDGIFVLILAIVNLLIIFADKLSVGTDGLFYSGTRVGMLYRRR